MRFSSALRAAASPRARRPLTRRPRDLCPRRAASGDSSRCDRRDRPLRRERENAPRACSADGRLVSVCRIALRHLASRQCQKPSAACRQVVRTLVASGPHATSVLNASRRAAKGNNPHAALHVAGVRTHITCAGIPSPRRPLANAGATYRGNHCASIWEFPLPGRRSWTRAFEYSARSAWRCHGSPANARAEPPLPATTAVAGDT